MYRLGHKIKSRTTLRSSNIGSKSRASSLISDGDSGPSNRDFESPSENDDVDSDDMKNLGGSKVNVSSDDEFDDQIDSDGGYSNLSIPLRVGLTVTLGEAAAVQQFSVDSKLTRRGM